MKIEMKTPLVEIDGDEMTHELWIVIKEKLLLPFINLKTEYYDLSVTNRDLTHDGVTRDAAKAILKYGAGVKCATITTTPERAVEYKLSALYPSPNATIRAMLDGTVFRSPILIPTVKCAVSTWKKPVVIARHAYGDVYKAAELSVPPEGGKAELLFTARNGSVTRVHIADMEAGGVLQAMHNLDNSIESFAKACFNYALSEKMPLWFAAKDTISKIYDGRFREIFDNIYKNEFQKLFEDKGIYYNYTLIDDAVARLVKSEGGFLWACKNYDGDVMSDLIASACGSLAMMTSTLVSPKGVFEYEAAHGTVRQHYYRWKNGEKPSTNPAALIFAWTGALSKRAELDALPELADFAKKLEAALFRVIQDGIMTADLQKLDERKPASAVDSWDFIAEIARRIKD